MLPLFDLQGGVALVAVRDALVTALLSAFGTGAAFAAVPNVILKTSFCHILMLQLAALLAI